MGAPSFTLLNGHIRTPLRFHQEGQTPFWASKCIEESQPCQQAVLSGRTSIPPFQAWAPLSDNFVTVTSWVIRRYNGGTDIDMDDYLSELDIVKFEEVYYVVHYGDAFGGLLPDEPLYCVISMSDGAVLTSELFHPKCGRTRTAYEFPFDTWCDWEISESGIAALGFLGVAGPPGGTPTVGDTWINTADDTIYTWAGAWLETPVTHGMVRFVRENCRWYEYDENSEQWEQLGPDSPWYITTGGICFGGNNPNDWTLLTDINLSGMEGFPGQAIMSLTVSNNTGGQLVVGVGSGSVVIEGNGTHELLIFAGAGNVFFTPSADFDGCITGLGFATYEDTCHYELLWTNCGNVGNTYYEEGFQNRYLVERELGPSRPTPSLSMSSTENGRKDVKDNFKRKQTEWVMDLGLVPWHIADALSDIPLHTNIRLALVDGGGEEELTNVRVEVSYDTPDQRCYASVSVFFQVLDSTVATNCCDTFEPLCDWLPYYGSVNSQEQWFVNGGSVFSSATTTIEVAGEPGLPLESPGYVVNLADGRVYYWNGSVWSVIVPTDGDIWYVPSTGAFYQFDGNKPLLPTDDEWVLLTGDDRPVRWGAGGMCFNEGVEFQANMVDTIPAGTNVRIRIFINDTSGSGAGYVSLGGTFSSFTGSGAWEFDVVTANPSTVVQVVLDSGFRGCVVSLTLCELIE